MNVTTLSSGAFCGALTDLYRRHHNRVLRACFRYVQNREEAEDLAQEAFLKAAGSWAEFRGTSLPGTWVHRIAVNHCLDHLRRKRQRRELAESLAAHGEAPPEEDEEFSVERMHDVLERMRNALTRADREIAYLRFDAGLTQEAIAKISGVSRTAIAKRLAKIRRRAFRIWKELEGKPRQAA